VHGAGKSAQQLVSGLVAVAVVCFLEIVEVEIQHAEARRRGGRGLQLLQIAVPVVKPRELVVQDVSPKGLFINNGVIENHGTLLVQNTGAVTQFDLAENSATDGIPNGSVVTDGGIIVQTGGALIFKKGCGGLTVHNGGTCVNGGAIISPGSVDLADGTLDIRKNGAFFCGYEYDGLIADFTTGKRKTSMTDRPSVTVIDHTAAAYRYNDASKLKGADGTCAFVLGQTGRIINAGALSIVNFTISERIKT